MEHSEPQLPLPDPTAPQVIEVGNNDYLALLKELRIQEMHIERIKVLSGGYELIARPK